MNLAAMQKAIRRSDVDGWLFCDFRVRETLAYSVLGLDREKHFTRRWFVFVPKAGQPRRLVNAIESGLLDDLPGTKTLYHSRETMIAGLRGIIKGAAKVAMQYSPGNNIPTISFADAGTVELVRSLGKKVVSSAELIQRLSATIDAKGFASHQRAGKIVQQTKDAAFALVFSRLQKRKSIGEYDVAKFILERFESGGLTSDNSVPIVGANAHAADPHFEPTAKQNTRIRKGDRLLIDLWARENTPSGIYYDITWCGYCGDTPPADYKARFGIVLAARDRAVAFIQDRLAKGRKIHGYEVDDACRSAIEKAGLGKFFFHRTGHSITHEVHGSGVNMDGLETRDDRLLLPGSLFSIEPGIYQRDIGVRTELNCYMDMKNKLHIAGAIQSELLTMKG
jgi:Xaa-Pro dipeptidase